MPFFNRVFWRPSVSDEVAEELAFHLEMRTRELIARGMDPAAARREAERRLGDLAHVRATLHTLGTGRNRHMQRTQYLGELAQDIAFTARQLRKNPRARPSRASVVRLILGQALRPVAIGAAAGIVAALGASQVLSSQLFGVSRTDPLTIAAVLATLFVVASVASAVPARRAAAVDPTRALQSE